MWAFLLVLHGILALSACAPTAPAEETTAQIAERPNIVFLLADDQRADSLSVAGHPFAMTPNIDRLARQGVRYENAFTVQPICAPSRFAFLSGQYERSSGLGFNSPYQVGEQQWQRTYPALLRDAGYHTGFVGKFGVQFYDLEGGAPGKFDFWRAHDGWIPFFPKDDPSSPGFEAYRNAEHDISTEIMGEYIGEFLDTRPADKPFSLSVSFSAPHNSVVSTMYPDGADPNCETYACKVMAYPANSNPKLAGHPVYDELYRDAGVEAAEDTGRDPYHFIPRGVIDHAARRKWYDYNYEPDYQPEHLIRYHQTVTGIDRVVGELANKLEELGIADNTVIIYSSDHGILNGEYGTGGKALLYDLVTKIPLVVFDPRLPASERGKVDGNLRLSIDVPATLLKYAGIAIPDTFEGGSLNDGGPPRSDIFLESLTVAEGNPFIEALRSREWKYVRYFEAPGCPYTEAQLDFSTQTPIFEQLFYLPDDPEERVNLVNDPAHAETLQEYRQKTRHRSARMTATGRRYKTDNGVPKRPEKAVYCW